MTSDNEKKTLNNVFPSPPPFPLVIDYFGFLDDAIDEQDSDTMSLSLECFLNSLQEYCSCVWPMFFFKLFYCTNESTWSV